MKRKTQFSRSSLLGHLDIMGKTINTEPYYKYKF